MILSKTSPVRQPIGTAQTLRRQWLFASLRFHRLRCTLCSAYRLPLCLPYKLKRYCVHHAGRVDYFIFLKTVDFFPVTRTDICVWCFAQIKESLENPRLAPVYRIPLFPFEFFVVLLGGCCLIFFS